MPYRPSGSPESAFQAHQAHSAFSAFQAHQATQAQSAFGPVVSPMTTEALITNRDGIVGAPLPISNAIAQNDPSNPADLARLSVDVRMGIYISALTSRATFTMDTHHGEPRIRLWQSDLVPPAVPSPMPTAQFYPFMDLTLPSIATFRDQMPLLTAYADLRQDRAAEIVAQLVPATAFFGSIGFMDGARTPYTVELLALVGQFAAIQSLRAKYALSAKRPIEFSPQIQPMIPTPTHGSLPSGHAGEAFAIARTLWKLLKNSNTPQYQDNSWGEMLMRQAARIAINRTVAGVHFPVDSAAGAMLGLTLADFVAQRSGQGSGQRSNARFDGVHYPATEDFDWHLLYDPATDSQKNHVGPGPQHWGHAGSSAKVAGALPLPALCWLWGKAQAEWNEMQTYAPPAGC